jgi:hypothetical protein
MARLSRKVWLLVTTLFAFCLTALTFPKVLTRHGHVVPGTGGDAGKNIFAFIYHMMYDRGFWFTGMNYPYGEQIVYTDGQPLLSVTLGYLGLHTPGQGLAVMWALIFTSYVLAIIFTFRILSHFGVRPLLAMIFAALIILLSPQMYRALGHFGLSYTCIVPMLFFWTIRYNQQHHWKYAVYILMLGLIANFLHPYFSAIILVWVMLYVLATFLFSKSTIWQVKIKHVAPLLGSILILFSIIGVVMKATDPVTDRPVTPYGLTAYCVRGIHIFTSWYSPVWRFFDGESGNLRRTSGEEGFTYPGIVVLAVIIISFISLFVKWLRARNAKDHVTHFIFPPLWLFMAFAALLFGMGVPFVWHMEWIVNYLSFLRQFRSLGRFAWIFYYIMTVYGVVVLCWYQARLLERGKKSLAFVMLISSVILWSFEASGYIQYERQAMSNSDYCYGLLTNQNHDGWPEFLIANHHNASDFQAILLMRFYNVGTDKLWLSRGVTDYEVEAGLYSGIQLHLPLVDAMMARSSWSRAEKEVKIAAGPYVVKPMLEDLNNNKPFLLLNAVFDTLDEEQTYLLQSSDYIGTYNNWSAYACYPARIAANDKKSRDSILVIAAHMTTKDTCIRCSGNWYVNHFDTGHAGNKFFGSGAVSAMSQEETVVTTVPLKPVANNQQYEFSCWFLVGDKNFRTPYFKLDILDSSGNIIATQDALTKESTDNEGLWFRCAAFFHVPAACTSIRCRLRNDESASYKIMDEMLLRPVGSIIISQSANGDVMANNHLVIP